MKLFILAVLLAVLTTAIDLQAQVATERSDEKLKLIWQKAHVDLPFNYYQGVSRGLSEDELILVTNEGQRLKVSDARTFSTIKSFDIPQYAYLAQPRLRDSSIIFVSSHEDVDTMTVSGDDPFYDGYDDRRRSRPIRIGLQRIDLVTGERIVIDTMIRTQTGIMDLDPSGELFFCSPYASLLEVRETMTGKRIAESHIRIRSNRLIHKASFTSSGPYALVKGVHTRKASDYLVVVHEDTLVVFSARSYKPLFFLSNEGSREYVQAVRLTASDKMILVRNDSIITIDLRTRSYTSKPLYPVNYSLDYVDREDLRTAHFVSDDAVLLEVGRQYSQVPSVVGVYDLAKSSFTRIEQIDPDERVLQLFEKTGGYVVGTRNEALRYTDLASKETHLINFFASYAYQILLDRASSTLLTHGTSGIHVADLVKLAPKIKFYEHGITTAALSPDHRYAALGTNSETNIYDLKDNSFVTRIKHGHYPEILSFSPVAKEIAIYATKNSQTDVTIYNILNGDSLRASPPLKWRSQVIFSRDGSEFYIGNGDTVLVCDAKTLKVKFELVGSRFNIVQLQTSSDNRYLVSQDQAARISVWDLKERTLRASYRTGAFGSCITPNSRYLLVKTDGGIDRIDLLEDKRMTVLSANKPTAFALSEDGERLAVADQDNVLSYYATPLSWYTGERAQLTKQFAPLLFFIPLTVPDAIKPDGQPFTGRALVSLDIFNDRGEFIRKLIDRQSLNKNEVHEWILDVSEWPKGRYVTKVDIAGRIEESWFEVK